MFNKVSTIAFVNNSLNRDLTLIQIEKLGIPKSQVVIFTLRDLVIDDRDDYGAVYDYGAKASLTFFGQSKFIKFYVKSSITLRCLLKTGSITRVFIPNSDNLLCNHVIQWAKRNPIVVATVAEGLMNYQNITPIDRAGWRWWSKAVISKLLGLKYQKPNGHLSGSFEASVTEVYSFSDKFLAAPKEKYRNVNLRGRMDKPITDKRHAIIVVTGINQWLPKEQSVKLSKRLYDFVKSRDFLRVDIKLHPNYSNSDLESVLGEFEVLQTKKSVEDILPNVEAGTVISTGSTALATIKFAFPEVECIDFGSDIYVAHAYRGDMSMVKFMKSLGVVCVESNYSGSASC